MSSGTPPGGLDARLLLSPVPRDSDAIVPTLSQLRGELLHLARGDHLDVLGYLSQPEARPPHVDWLRSFSGYRSPEFAATWGAVADFLARD